MSNYYLLQLKPFDEKERNDPKIVQPFQAAVIKAKVCGMGWSNHEIFKHFKTKGKLVLNDSGNKDIYYKLYHEKNDKIEDGETVKFVGYRSFATALNIYNEMSRNDYILTRLDNSRCYIGRVTSKAYYDLKKLKKINNKKNMNLSWIVNVDWKFIGSELNIPGSLQGILRKRQNTAQRIYGIEREIIKKIYESKKNKKEIEKTKLTADNFCEAFNSDELEDLVAFYIQDLKENKGFRLVPSTCKYNTKKYEFKFTDGRHSIVAQVKNQKKIIVSNYIEDERDYIRVYLFSGICEYENFERIPTNIMIINRDKLFHYLKKNYYNKGYFYQVLKDFFVL